MDTFGQPDETTDTEHLTTGKAKRYLAAAALLSGGLVVGALVSPIGIADAQSDDSTTTEEPAEGEADSTTSDDESGPHRKGRRGGQKLEDLSAIIGLSQDELREQFGAGLSLAEIAEAQEVTTDALVDALVANVEERLAQAVSDGRIDQDAADERLADAGERVQEFIERTPGERGEGAGRGGRHSHRGGPGIGLDALSELLEVSADDIRGALADGQTLAEVASEAGVPSDELVSALVDAASERIDEALADERIDAEKADEMKASLEARITERVNAEPGERGNRGGPGHRGPRGGSVTDSGVEETVYTA